MPRRCMASCARVSKASATGFARRPHGFRIASANVTRLQSQPARQVILERSAPKLRSRPQTDRVRCARSSGCTPSGNLTWPRFPLTLRRRPEPSLRFRPVVRQRSGDRRESLLGRRSLSGACRPGRAAGRGGQECNTLRHGGNIGTPAHRASGEFAPVRRILWEPFADVAQLVEHFIVMKGSAGSNPRVGFIGLRAPCLTSAGLARPAETHTKPEREVRMTLEARIVETETASSRKGGLVRPECNATRAGGITTRSAPRSRSRERTLAFPSSGSTFRCPTRRNELQYHGENAQEDLLVLSGECLLLIEGEERPLKQWDPVPLPRWTEHVFVGAGPGRARS